MDRKTFIKSIAVIGASPAFAAGVSSKDADGKNKTKSESFGGGFVPSARIFKTGQHQSQWILMKDAALDKDPQSIIFKVFIAVG